ncbi:MAG: alpha/beta hydrolase [Pseudomonadota bacterium]
MIRAIFRLVLLLLVLAAVSPILFWYLAGQRETQSINDLALPGSRIVETVHGGLHVLEAGAEDGQVVLLVHGAVGWSGLWQDTLEVLSAQGYRAVAVDLPPMGLSERVSGTDFSLQAQALRLLALAETFETPPILVGHSLGAAAAAEALLIAQDTFSGAVLVSAYLRLGQDGTDATLPFYLQYPLIREGAVATTLTNPFATKFLFETLVHQKGSVSQADVDLLHHQIGREDTTALWAEWLPDILIAPVNAGSSDPALYTDLEAPLAMIWGREDTVVLPSDALALQEALGDAPIYWMDNVGHIPQIEAADAFHQLLVTALARIDQG